MFRNTSTFIILFILGFFASVSYSQIKKKNTNSGAVNSSLQSKINLEQPIDRAYESDYVIIGTIKSIENTPAPISEMFHSKVIVKIDSILKGTLNFKNIIIRLQSGAVTNDLHGGTGIVSSIEPRFEVGEHAVFFFKKMGNDNYIISKGIHERYQSFDGKGSIKELASNIFWIDNTNVFKIDNDEVYYFDTRISKNDFIKQITK